MSDLDYDLVKRLQRRVGDRLSDENERRQNQGQATLSEAMAQHAVRGFTSQVINEHVEALAEQGQARPSWEVESALSEAIYARIFGVGELQHLVDDPEIENIDINGCDDVWVTYGDGRTAEVPPVAGSDDELIELIQVLGTYSGLAARPFDPANPELDVRLPDGSRLSAVMGVTERPVASIRRNRLEKVSLADLIGNGTVSTEVADFLAAAIRAKLNILICGATNAGKTTLLRALAREVGPGERIVTVERALELGLAQDKEAHPNSVAMEEQLPNAEGHGAKTLGDLVKRSLRMNPDRVIVGEVLGDEIVTMLNAMSQGNDGSLSTIHSKGARDSFNRIVNYALQARDSGLDVRTIHHMISTTIDLVVFVKRDVDRIDGHRSVREVLEVVGYDNGQAVASMLYGDDGTGLAVEQTPITEDRLERLVKAGWKPTEGGGPL